ncbi:FG-GAP-like repeat-containing protein [Marinirhabdus gelatinilytica]|uniref:Putative secreted protein (Por secretion system target) n=1 Tax=Marinirhabdus gelatinilytica TaxID=1703343 RepID=A0A370QAF4_9FLAO|nr:FG-GAP-like repeat-containing protein [Marinirhabdus gelatinilytica]RDK85354.1 putative secreted protein (Por secretion system target) [Marinirhabdus gelatinilytica]
MQKCLILLLLLNYSLHAQVTFSPHDISHNLSFPVVNLAGDIDNDGDMDIISGGQGSESIEWYENVDGDGNFSVSHFVADGFNTLYDIHLADLDGDNDLDVLSSSYLSHEVAWFENIDGQGNFGTRNILSDIEMGSFGIDTADLDGDNDIDVLTSSDFSPFGYFWHENLDGLGDFGSGISLSQTNRPRRIKAGDLDNDGDNDIVYVNSEAGVIAKSENLDGQGNFGNQLLVADQETYVDWINLVDFDQDNDLDIISNNNVPNNTLPGGEIVWYSNVEGNFGSIQIIANMEEKPSSIQPVDFDNDGDYDIVFTSVLTSNLNGSVSWIENLGSQNFGPIQPIIESNFNNPRSISVADIDGDGDMDFIATSASNDKVTWFENLSILGMPENDTVRFSIIPNPTSKMLNITCDKKIASIRILNSAGRLVLKSEYKRNVNIETLTAGVYFVKVLDQEGIEGNKKLLIY